MMYNAVIQTVIINRTESWLSKEAMLKVLEGFHHHVDRRISVISAQRVGEGVWER